MADHDWGGYQGDGRNDSDHTYAYDAYYDNGSSEYFNYSFDYGENPYEEPHVRYPLLFMYSCVSLSCILGNSLVILVIMKQRKMRNITNFLLANLAASDLCVGVFCVMPTILQYLYPYWIMGRVMCRLHFFVQSTSYTASIIILTVISMERYFAIIHPMLSKRMSRLCLLRVVVIIVWLIAIANGLPLLISYDTVKTEGVEFCVRKKKHHLNVVAIMVVNFVLWYVVPLVLMTAMYAKISVVLWRSSTRAASLSESTTYSSSRKRKTQRLRLEMEMCSTEPETEQTLVQGVRGCRSESPRPPSCAIQTCGPVGKKEASLKQQPEHAALVAVATSGTDTDRNDTREQGAISSEMESGTFTKPGNSRRPISNVVRILQNGSGQDSTSDSSDPKTDQQSSRGSRVKIFNYERLRQFRRQKKQQTDAKCKTPRNALIARRKVIRLLIAIIVAFALCVLPHQVRLLWQTMSDKSSFTSTHLLVPAITYLVFYFNSCLNPFLYAFLSDNFRKSLRDLCCGCKRRGCCFRKEKMLSFNNSRTQNSAL